MYILTDEHVSNLAVVVADSQVSAMEKRAKEKETVVIVVALSRKNPTKPFFFQCSVQQDPRMFF